MPHNAMLKRIRAEYLEMPGLRLTMEQVQRLCGVEPLMCSAVLTALVDAKFLCANSDATFARLTDENLPRRRVRRLNSTSKRASGLRETQ